MIKMFIGSSYILQLIPGHEAVGHIVDMGKNVTGFELGDRIVADVGGELLRRCVSALWDNILIPMTSRNLSSLSLL